MNRKLFAILGLGAMLLGAPALRADHHEGKSEGDMIPGMKEKMGMSDAQMEKVKAARKAHMEAMKPLREKMKADMDTLKGLVDKKGSDAKLKTSISAVKEDYKAIQDQQKKHHEAMQEFMTPMQQAKAILMMGEHMKGGMEMMKRHKGDWGKHDDKDDDDDDDDKHETEKKSSKY